MIKGRICFGILALLLSSGVWGATTVFANPTSATVTIEASQIGVSTVAPLQLIVTHTFDVAPSVSARCVVRLYGVVSRVDGSEASGRWTLASKRNVRTRTVRFRYRGVSMRLTNGKASQLNVQTVSDCGPNRITSNSDATNVTCRRGSTQAGFIFDMREKFRSASQLNSSRAAAVCAG